MSDPIYHYVPDEDDFERLMRALCAHGKYERVEAWDRPIGWDRLGKPNLPVSSIMSYLVLTKEPANCDRSYAALIGYARRDGRDDIFEIYEAAEPTDPISRLEPIASLIERGFTQVLAKFLEAGFDPTVPMGKAGLSGMDIAAAAEDPSAAVSAELFRGWIAQQSAASLSRPAADATKAPLAT